MEARLSLVGAEEWLEETAAPGAPPRLLSLLWRRQAAQLPRGSVEPTAASMR